MADNDQGMEDVNLECRIEKVEGSIKNAIVWHDSYLIGFTLFTNEYYNAFQNTLCLKTQYVLYYISSNFHMHVSLCVHD